MEKARQIFLRTVAIFMVAIMFVGIAPASSLAELDLSAFAVKADAADDVEFSTTKAPEGYMLEASTKPKVSLSDAMNYANVDVLLIQDNLPWDSYANETVLERLGIKYHLISTSELEYTDIWNYKMIIIANDQTFSTYSNFKAFKSRLDLFANLGGVLLFGACDSGWANGEMDFELPGGVRKVSELATNNYIVNRSHPIVSGKLTDKKALSNNELYSHYCSHNYFIESTLPKGTNIILRSSDSHMPTLVEYSYGSGHVIASALTWEHNYIYGGVNERFNKFAAKAMDDYFAYGYSLCQNKKIGEKMEIFEDNNSFEHDPDYFFDWYEADRYHIDNDLFYKLISAYNNDMLKWENIPNIAKLIQTRLTKEWGGSCYGISASMALVHAGEVDLKNFDRDAKNYYDADQPKDNARFRSLINYYQLSQYLPVVDKKIAYVDEYDSHVTMLKTIVNMALESEKTGYPFVFSFGYEWLSGSSRGSGGHAIVCVGCKETASSYRLEFIDPNETGEYIYASVPHDFSRITFDHTYTSADQRANRGREDWRISRVGYTTLTAFNSIDIDGSNNRYVVENGAVNKDIDFSDDALSLDVMMVNSNSEFTITNDIGETLAFDGAEFSGDMPFAIVNCFENDESADYQIITPRSEEYSIEQARDAIDITIYNGDDEFYSFDGTGAENIEVDMGTGISATGTDMDCNIYCGVDEAELDMVSVSNSQTDAISVEHDYYNSEVVVDADNMANMEYTGYYDNNVQDISNEANRQSGVDYLPINDIHVHNYEITRKEATCTDDGLVEYYCDCGDYYTETIPALGMEHNISWVTVKPASVFESGLQEQVCSNCNHIFQTKKIAQKKPATPKLTSASRVAGGVKVKWSEIDGADSFYVYRKTKKSGWTKIATVGGFTYSYTDKKAKTGITYYYTVKAKNEAGTSGYNKSGIAVKYVAAPKIKSATNGTSSIKVTWNKISGADGYYLYRKVYGAKKSTKIATIKKGSTVSYTDKKAKSGVDYVYIVKAYDGKTVSSYYSDGYWVRRLTAPKLVSAKSTSSGILVKWKQVSGAAGYYVYRKTGKGKWQSLGYVGSNYIGAYDNSTKKGKTYTYTVRAYYGNHKSAYNTKGLKVKDKH